MADQGTTRREAMQILAYASIAGKAGGLRVWTFACNHGVQNELKSPSLYQPQFFSPWEYQMVQHLTELIIPNDGTPGAREAGVSEFIDFMVANSADVGMFRYQPANYKKPLQEDERIPDAMQSRNDIQSQFRFGLNWLEGHSHRCFRRGFLECTPEQQTEILIHLAYKDRFRDGEEEGRAFFQLIRRYTVMGFYTTRIGLEHLDYRGLVTYWMVMPPCPHKDDPEHLHLPPAGV